MSTIFGHGRLRLYLLKLLDESPRHGYEIISLLRDRFLGVYSPSPGTIYPRLARLEEEGLVTHEEVDGRKVYRLTDKGRAELRDRGRDLDDLEREITESVRDIAQAVQRDVRDTISHLREELKVAARATRRDRSRQEKTEEAGAEDVWGKAATEGAETGGHARGRAGEREHGFRWNREWEKFAHGFSWGTRVRGATERGACTDFERTLRDFADRVRDVAREAGTVSEAAVSDLRRILDETLEVIRRDAAHWGPPESTAKRPEEETEKAAPPKDDSGPGSPKG
ncbi:PadR family transcriptional regulator [Thermobifida halotolerans]|uniref:PadR family transcriptional regulator n=1 Tax=Thermobifida halotolerans TaxID=483545 RepID=A0A399FZZ0_9ACTN|nr:PadR family transcriptional regulator [Thermobifida halotolerans]UOE19643.1 PadR family transcriptional regulator [Thermobifida halotolerans]